MKQRVKQLAITERLVKMKAGRSAAQGRAVLDQQAAVRILQSFLDQPEAKRKTI